MKKITALRKKYPLFIYKDYSWKKEKNSLSVNFDFQIPPDISFKPKLKIKNLPQRKIKEEVLDNFIFHLGLVEMISYWKATCSPKIKILAGKLNKDQIKWWQHLIRKGMGQFFYENKINFKEKNFLRIETVNENKRKIAKDREKKKEKVIVPIGGGKDSVVTLELMKNLFEKKDIYCFSLNPKMPAQKIMKIFGCRNKIIVERKIDKKLLSLNQMGFLNGHTPFSAYLAFLSKTIAYLLNVKYIAFSNERSSNEGNVKYLGEIINHQYSKSLDFEKRFREYSKKYLSKEIEYFSFLRPLYEIQIAERFSHYREYFHAFLSCNEAFKTDSGKKKPTGTWCGKCPKCLFVFTSLYPFVEEKELVSIFQKNLFQNKNLIPLMQKLIGERGFKPFECVGTKKESLVAFYLSWKKARSKNYPLLRYFEKNILPKHENIEKEVNSITKISKKHSFPSELEETLFTLIKKIKRGNVYKESKIQDPKEKGGQGGWVFGWFAKKPFKTEEFEIKFGNHKKGERKKDLAFNEKAKTFVVLIEGEMQINFYTTNNKPLKVILKEEGDSVFYEAGVVHDWIAIKKSRTITIRWPSIPDDQNKKT